MARWRLEDIAWARFARAKLDPDLVRIVRAAALVEYNGAAYAHHLCRVFGDDPEFQADLRRWGEEEIQHGAALGRWSELADPDFQFTAAFARFRENFRADFDRGSSRRGSRAGEMVARCIVESATSSYYQALRDAAEEPVLKEICHNIAADEVRHYKLFYQTLERYLAVEPIGVCRRLLVALNRLAESQDDELASAYHAANAKDEPYDRRRYARAYARRAFVLYRKPHVARGVRMVMRAIGVAPRGRVANGAASLAWAALRHYAIRLNA
jgi:Fatty acid desaturase